MKRFSLTIKMDSATEFKILPVADPLFGDDFISHFGDHAESDVSITCDVDQNSAIGKHDDGLTPFLPGLFENARKLFLAPLDEDWKTIRADNPDLGEKMLDCFGMLAVVDHNHFGDRNAVLGEADMKRYAKLTLAALRFTKSVADVEQSFYKLDDLEYDVHFDFLNRNLIISKSHGRGIIGWLRKHSRRGYGIRNNGCMYHLLTLKLAPLPCNPNATRLQNDENRLQNAPRLKDGQRAVPTAKTP